MKNYAKPLTKLIAELSKLPGIGGKSAQRLAFYILSMNDEEAAKASPSSGTATVKETINFRKSASTSSPLIVATLNGP